MASFGKYQVVEQIGQGGFGKVYKGFDPALKREVAIKTCSFQSQDLRERFVREAEISANLKHPNIVTVYDFGEEAGEPYLVQEYLPGEDLDQKIKRGEALALSARLDYLIQIAEGLRFAHTHGVVHRDVKPANMRVQPDGQVRIMDFGIAKLVEAERQLTRVGMSVGTTGYLAPEQLRGEAIDHRADIFSFGVMAYELVAYRKPFDGDSVSTIFYRIAHEEPPPLPELAPDCPPRLAACIARCLEKDPARRYDDFAGVLEDLRAVKAELTTDGAGVGAPSTAAAVPAGSVSGASATQDAGAEPAPRRWLRSPALWGLGLAALIVAVLGVLNLSQLAESQSASPSAGPASPSAGPPSGASGSSTQAGSGTAVSPNGAVNTATTAATGAAGATSGAGASRPSGVGKANAASAGRAGPPGAGGASSAGTGPAHEVASPPRTQRTQGAAPRPAGATSPVAAGAAAPATDLSTARILVLVGGEVDAASQAADAALTGALTDAGRDVVDADNMGDVQAPAGIRATPGQLGDMRRATGAGVIVLATLRTNVVASVGAFFTGTATLVTRAYDARTGRLLHAETFQVGGQTPGKLGSSPESARSAAAAQVARLAAVKILQIGATP